MHDDDDSHEHSDYNTPFDDPETADSSPWAFHDARVGASPSHRPAQCPRVRRHSSLPRALFAGSSSIFGSGPPPSMEQQEQIPERPAVSTSPPQDAGPSARTQSPLFPLGEGFRRSSRGEDEARATSDRRRLPRVEKDADDPSTPPVPSRPDHNRQQTTTLTTLSRLFAVQAASSPEDSRSSSHIQHNRPFVPYARQLHSAETAALPEHLYTRGLLDGRHSDITVNAFGHKYKLHRLILDRAPFFRSALSEPWLESNAKETTICPEDVDSNITQTALELALKRLYGCSNLIEEDANAVGLFATGCWLEMQDLVDASIESILRQMTTETLAASIKLVTTNYYGRAGDKILASAKAMLCRDGWTMPLRSWDGIPGDVVREIVGGDGFFIEGEWDRWVLAKRILDRRLRGRAAEAGLLEPGSKRKVMKAPDVVMLMAVRFDGVYRKNTMGAGRGIPDSLHRWITPYTQPDVEPILVLLDEGIHYIHLEFEQLQLIRRARDVFGLPVMPEKVISNALWQQMELRQRVMRARDSGMELDLSQQCTDDMESATRGNTTMNIATPSSPLTSAKGKHKADTLPDISSAIADEDLDSGSWDGNGKPRKFWIPSSDCNIVMGGDADPMIATSSNASLQRHASRLSATIQPEDVQWASDFAAVTSQYRPGTASSDGQGPSPNESRYSNLPPFRFAASFPNPRLLKNRKRVYSRTVFYAGSLWNIYVQKVVTPRSKHLGVYLHRAKEQETEEVIAGTSGLAQGSVDERIGQLEREMLLGRDRRNRERGDGGDSEGSAGPADGESVDAAATAARAQAMRNLQARSYHQPQPRPDPCPTSQSVPSSLLDPSDADPDSLGLSPDDEEGDPAFHLPSDPTSTPHRRHHIPAIPPYFDGRPSIKTYFKIYSPSRGGRMLSVYESAPEKFNFGKSWGWKSSTLMLDEGMWADGDEEADLGGAEGEKVSGEREGGAGLGMGGRGQAGGGDGKLRFMVVIGNV